MAFWQRASWVEVSQATSFYTVDLLADPGFQFFQVVNACTVIDLLQGATAGALWVRRTHLSYSFQHCHHFRRLLRRFVIRASYA
jgi:hypothetical protein